VRREHELEHGDEIRIGRTKLTFLTGS